MTSPIEQLHVTTVDIEGRRFNVSVAVEFDGVEHVGHLWFEDDEWDDDGFRDHGSIPGSSPDEVLAHARQLSQPELVLRFQRAQSDKRRFHGLRRATQDVLNNIRYLNKVATSMRAGLLDVEEAAAEIDETERKLHAMVGQLRHFAGVTA
ncbi:MAG: hypothetical protein IT359_02600 [Gemmatimonadaceae bacterium]|nr:hypothetical protein [Gemmatimonadaceae bacterium]